MYIKILTGKTITLYFYLQIQLKETKINKYLYLKENKKKEDNRTLIEYDIQNESIFNFNFNIKML